MKKTFGLVMAIGMLSGVLGGCSYGAIGVNAAGDKVVITRHDLFLLGALRKVYVCKVQDRGLTDCSVDESP